MKVFDHAWSRFAAIVVGALVAVSVTAHAADPDKKEIRFGATAGPYSDQIRYGIKPLL